MGIDFHNKFHNDNWFVRLNLLFTYFINEPKDRLDLLKLLQVACATTPRRQMRTIVAEVEQCGTHPLAQVAGRSDRTHSVGEEERLVGVIQFRRSLNELQSGLLQSKSRKGMGSRCETRVDAGIVSTNKISGN